MWASYSIANIVIKVSFRNLSICLVLTGLHQLKASEYHILMARFYKLPFQYHLQIEACETIYLMKF